MLLLRMQVEGTLRFDSGTIAAGSRAESGISRRAERE